MVVDGGEKTNVFTDMAFVFGLDHVDLNSLGVRNRKELGRSSISCDNKTVQAVL